jgi:Phosphoesterase family
MKFVFLFLAAVAMQARPALADEPSHVGLFKHIITVVLENTDYSSALDQPFLASLIKRGATFRNFHAESHPSQPNYVAMISGSTSGVYGDGQVNLGGNHVGDLLEAAGLDWKVYAEDYPGNCFLGMTSGDYARKHVPFISFKNVQQNSARCAKVATAGDFDTDSAGGALPAYTFYVPNLKNDGHDTGVAYADKWLQQKFGPMLNDPAKMDGTLFVVTFDESESPFDSNNQILTILVGNMVKPGVDNNDNLNHYSLLRLVEENFGLGTLSRGDSSAAAINGVWQ